MGVLNCGCEQKGNERVERALPANHKSKRVLERVLGRGVLTAPKSMKHVRVQTHEFLQ